MEAIKVPIIGPVPLDSLSDYRIEQIIGGSAIPTQAASKALAIEVREARIKAGKWSGMGSSKAT